MNIEEFRTYCLAKAATSESLPFDQNTLVFKVHSKMFALTDMELFDSINLKCEPEYAIELRERYYGIRPGYHMNKIHWNTVLTDGSVPEELVKELIDLSYELVARGQRRKVRDSLK